VKGKKIPPFRLPCRPITASIQTGIPELPNINGGKTPNLSLKKKGVFFADLLSGFSSQPSLAALDASKAGAVQEVAEGVELQPAQPTGSRRFLQGAMLTIQIN
jgi:hypothetical protein